MYVRLIDHNEVKDSVLDSPSVVIMDTYVPSESNLELTLLCSAPSIPPPKIRWYRNSQSLVTNGPNISLHSQGKTRLSFLIPHVTSDILGVYSCTASNSHGQSRKEYILRGQFEPNDLMDADKTISGVPQSPIMTPHQEQKLSNILQYTLSWSTLTPFPVVEYHLRYRKWSASTSDKWWNIVVPERKLPQQFMVTSDYTLRGLFEQGDI